MQRIALVVDDSRVARMTLKKLLSEYEFDVIELGSGEEAIDYLQAENTKPDIIFMDVMMGGMDGLATTKKIKAIPSVMDIPVIICTGNNTEEDKIKAIEVGAVTALTKPPAAEALAEIIAGVERSVTAPAVEQEPVAAIPQFNEAEITANILMTVEQALLPKAHQDARDTAEEISRQIVADLIETLVEEQINTRMKQVSAELTEQVTIKTKVIVEKTAQEVCTVVAQESAMVAAENAVQVVIDEADITTQVSQFLSEKGEEWLADQEEDLGTQLSEQLERLIPSICTQYLDTHLTDIVLPLVADQLAESRSEPLVNMSDTSSPGRSDINEMISLALHQHSNTVISPIVSNMVNKQLAAQTLLEQDEEAIDLLTGQMTKLKSICFVLSVAVVGLFIATIV